MEEVKEEIYEKKSRGPFKHVEAKSDEKDGTFVETWGRG